MKRVYGVLEKLRKDLVGRDVTFDRRVISERDAVYSVLNDIAKAINDNNELWIDFTNKIKSNGRTKENVVLSEEEREIERIWREHGQ